MNLHNQKIEGRRVEYRVIFLISTHMFLEQRIVTNSLSSSLSISAFYSPVHNLKRYHICNIRTRYTHSHQLLIWICRRSLKVLRLSLFHLFSQPKVNCPKKVLNVWCVEQLSNQLSVYPTLHGYLVIEIFSPIFSILQSTGDLQILQ